MSKSLKRVTAALVNAGVDAEILNLDEGTRTAKAAAEAAGCEVDQIAKSIVFVGQSSGEAILFVTAGGNQVDSNLATAVAGEDMGKADAALIRSQTGFAIGGVSPVGHINPIRAFFDPTLLTFTEVWAAAGTPNHIFKIDPATLMEIAGAEIAEFVAPEP